MRKGGVYVSKKKRRYANRTGHTRTRNCRDVHHILFIGRKWGYGDLASLRQYWYCRIAIPRDTLHRYIHENLANVPTPRQENAREALRQLRLLERHGAIHDTDIIERRLEILIALFDCVEPKTADGLKKQLEIVREFYNEPP